MTFCYTIKNGNIGFFKYIIREVYFIFQAFTISKPKYIRVILKQVHIFDTKVANSIFQ